MTDGKVQPLADKVSSLSTLAASLSASEGPHYAALAQLSGLAQDVAELSGDVDVLAAAIAASLSRVLTYPLHDHPQFNELIAVHAAALEHAVKDKTAPDSPKGVELMRRIETAVGRIVPPEPANPD